MEHQQFLFDLFGNQRVAKSHQSKQETLAGFRHKKAKDMLIAPSEK
jgi:hypothetical protein